MHDNYRIYHSKVEHVGVLIIYQDYFQKTGLNVEEELDSTDTLVVCILGKPA